MDMVPFHPVSIWRLSARHRASIGSPSPGPVACPVHVHVHEAPSHAPVAHPDVGRVVGRAGLGHPRVCDDTTHVHAHVDDGRESHRGPERACRTHAHDIRTTTGDTLDAATTRSRTCSRETVSSSCRPESCIHSISHSVQHECGKVAGPSRSRWQRATCGKWRAQKGAFIRRNPRIFDQISIEFGTPSLIGTAADTVS